MAKSNPETENIVPFLYKDIAYPKELNFFRDDLVYKAGVDWYKSHFTEELPSVDVSPNYLLSPPADDISIHKTLDRIEDSGFSGNFIVVLRNPIDRSFSAYNHYKQDLPRSKEWGTWFPEENYLYNMKNNAHMVQNYNIGIRGLIERFGRNRLTILISERLRKGIQSEYDKLYSNVGVDSIPYAQLPLSAAHQRTYPYTLTDKTRAQVQSLYADQVEELYELIGWRIRAWKDFM